MRYVTTVLLAFALLWGVCAQAGDGQGKAQIKNNPITIEGGESERMTVIFSHRAHRNIGVNCLNCHHETSTDFRYSACRDCHSEPGARERDPMSMFMAFHAKETDRSCYGCHSRLSAEDPKKYPAFKGCQPCHMGPKAREAAAAAKKAAANQ